MDTFILPLSFKDTEIPKCRVCGEAMELMGYFPEPATIPNPIANWWCADHSLVTIHYMGGR